MDHQAYRSNQSRDNMTPVPLGDFTMDPMNSASRPSNPMQGACHLSGPNWGQPISPASGNPRDTSPPIALDLQRLQDVVTEATDQFCSLLNKIGPVLSPLVDQCVKGSDHNGPTNIPIPRQPSQLSDTIRGHCARIERLYDEIRQTRERVEL